MNYFSPDAIVNAADRLVFDADQALIRTRGFWHVLIFLRARRLLLMDINVRLLGAPRNTPQFEHTKKYRGVSFNIGDRVKVGASEGFVCDRNDSANFQVEFVSGPYAGGQLSVHPSEIEVCK